MKVIADYIYKNNWIEFLYDVHFWMFSQKQYFTNDPCAYKKLTFDICDT